MVVSILTTAIVLLTIAAIAFAARLTHWREASLGHHSESVRLAGEVKKRENEIKSWIVSSNNKDATAKLAAIEIADLKLKVAAAQENAEQHFADNQQALHECSRARKDVADRDVEIAKFKNACKHWEQLVDKLNATIKELMATVDRQKAVMVEADKEDAIAIERTKKRDEALAKHTRALLELILDEPPF